MNHENLFDYYENKTGVYRKLQEDYVKDRKLCKWHLAVCFILCVSARYITNDMWKVGLLLVAGLAIIQYILIFIDNSNRNFLMHTIDWIEANNSNVNR